MHEMVRDMNEAKEDFVGGYSRSYTKQIINEIEKNNLNEFRSWISGPAGIWSYSGGLSDCGRIYGWNFHPFDKGFEKIDNNFVIRNFNKIVNGVGCGSSSQSSSSNVTSGFTKVCYYNGVGGQSSRTVSSTSICPLTNSSGMSGFTKVCTYNTIGGKKAITVNSVSLCPIAYPN